MQQIEQVIQVACAVGHVYNQFTQFTVYPRFLPALQEVHQLDERRVHWRAELDGRSVAGDIEITVQEPDRRIAWRSVSGPVCAGSLRFDQAEGSATRVRLSLAYQAEGGGLNDFLTLLHALEQGLNALRDFLESRGEESGAWRGELPKEPRALQTRTVS